MLPRSGQIGEGKKWIHLNLLTRRVHDARSVVGSANVRGDPAQHLRRETCALLEQRGRRDNPRHRFVRVRLGGIIVIDIVSGRAVRQLRGDAPTLVDKLFVPVEGWSTVTSASHGDLAAKSQLAECGACGTASLAAANTRPFTRLRLDWRD